MKNTDKKIFISGAISSRMDTYKQEFAKFENELRVMGYHNILSPAILPSEGFSYEDYMNICYEMLKACDVVVFMPGWEFSTGCQTEHVLAVKHGKQICIGLHGAEVYANGGCNESQ